MYTARVHMFGLTGGIASGKSAVAKRLRERGVPVIDADELAREVVLPGTPGLAELAQAFGEGILQPNGELDRKALAAIVFTDPEKRRRMNGILHPRISALTMTRGAELAQSGEPLVCYEAALLVENGLADVFRPLVVVTAPESVQVSRTVARDKATEEEARARIVAQLPLAEKVKAADLVIENDGTLEELREKTDHMLSILCARLAVDESRFSPR